MRKKARQVSCESNDYGCKHYKRREADNEKVDLMIKDDFRSSDGGRRPTNEAKTSSNALADSGKEHSPNETKMQIKAN